MLWWVVGVLMALIIVGVVGIDLYGRAARKNEKRLSRRRKRRIEL
jgi:hypothetical protein